MNKLSKVLFALIFFVFIIPVSVLLVIKYFGDENEILNSNSAKINQKILNNAVYITPLEIISDSRCPASVTCIWEGTVVVKVKLEKEGTSQEINLELNKDVVFSDKKILLNLVLPSKLNTKEIPKDDYIFTFKVD